MGCGVVLRHCSGNGGYVGLACLYGGEGFVHAHLYAAHLAGGVVEACFVHGVAVAFEGVGFDGWG